MRVANDGTYSAFTLAEMLVSVAVLTLVILLVTRLLNSASTITTLGNKHIDTDNQARPVLDRMAEDFSQMINRSDVDYYVKQPSDPQTGTGKTGKNDQIAFYSQVEGYYPTSSQSHLSLVAYRLNSDPKVTTASLNKLERLGKGLSWNGSSTTATPMVFLPIPLASPSSTAAWPQAGNMAADPDGNYEVVGPQVFRFEYYYEWQDGTLNATPYTGVTPNHTAVNGLQDVKAIIVEIAAIDPKSRALVSDSQLTTLAGNMSDYPPSTGTLQSQWQGAINNPSTNGLMPRSAAAGIHIYQRTFYINSRTQ